MHYVSLLSMQSLLTMPGRYITLSSTMPSIHGNVVRINFELH